MAVAAAMGTRRQNSKQTMKKRRTKKTRRRIKKSVKSRISRQKGYHTDNDASNRKRPVNDIG